MTIPEMIQRAANCHQAGKHEEAIALCRQVLQVNANEPNALNYLGTAAQQAGRMEEAVQLFAQAVNAAPGAAHLQLNLSLGLTALKRWEPAGAAARAAVQLDPKNAAAWNHLGGLLRRSGRTLEAINCLRNAVQIRPDSADYHGHLGMALQSTGQLLEAAAAYRRSLQLRPDDYRVHSNLGDLLLESGQVDEAIAQFTKVLQLKPELPEGYNNLGLAHFKKGDVDTAAKHLAHALKLKSNYADAQGNLAMVHLGRGELDETLTAYKKAAELNPRDAVAAGSLLFAIQFHPDWTAQAILKQHREFNDRFALPLARTIRPHSNDALPERRLRVGYVSSTFRRHVLSLYTIPLLAHHDAEAVEVYCYSDVSQSDDATERLRPHADQWRPIVGMTHAAIAEQIRADKIDILIDLNMHMAGGRPLLFARKPAPVQVAWLAYPGTTGLSAMDYRLTDPRLDPEGETDAFYTERSIRLPDTFWCFDSTAAEGQADPPVSELPLEANGFITFGCLNNFCKINGGVWELWSRVMRATPRSRLLLLTPAGECRRRVIESLGGLGVAADRIGFVDRQSRRGYLASFHRIDISLDTLPYNGHTTSLDSQWMGVPVVSCQGHTLVGRAGLSQAFNLGLTELVAADTEQFVKIAVELAGDSRRLAEMRRSLRERMRHSPLTDAKRFAANMEAAYRTMWRRWCETPVA